MKKTRCLQERLKASGDKTEKVNKMFNCYEK